MSGLRLAGVGALCGYTYAFAPEKYFILTLRTYIVDIRMHLLQKNTLYLLYVPIVDIRMHLLQKNTSHLLTLHTYIRK